MPNLRTAAFTSIFHLICIFGALCVSATGQAKSPILTKNGQTDPGSIPDSVAFEFFIRSLIPSPSEIAASSGRVAAFAKQTKIKEPQVEDFLADIRASYERLEAFNRKAKKIKDQSWPNPRPEIWDQLNELQRQKEQALTDQINSILAHRTAGTAELLRQFVKGHIKSRIKGYADQPNPDQMPRLGIGRAKFSHLRTPLMQMQDTVYIYADAVHNTGDEYVYGYGDVQASYSAYGHEYSARVELSGPCGQFFSSEGNVASVELDLCDGQFDFTTTGVQFCPIANSTQDVGTNSDSEIVQAFIRINAFSAFNPLSVNINGTSSITGSFSTSRSFSGNVLVEWGYELSSGSAPIIIDICDGVTFLNIGPGRTLGIQCSYKPTLTTSSQTRIRAVVQVGGVNAETVTRASTGTLLINK
jgi:hypothetical protein